MKKQPRISVGTIALCGLQTIGMITEAEPKEIKYADGKVGLAYVGIHLTDKIAPIGSPWSSRHPNVIGHISDCLEAYVNGNSPAMNIGNAFASIFEQLFGSADERERGTHAPIKRSDE